jgi:hypothetical protein
MLETEIGKTTSHAVENSLRRRFWNFRTTDYGKNETTKPFNKGRKPAASPPFHLISYGNSCQDYLGLQHKNRNRNKYEKMWLTLKWMGIPGNLLVQNWIVMTFRITRKPYQGIHDLSSIILLCSYQYITQHSAAL